MLMPKAAIRIVQCSAGAGSWRGNEKIANRRQQQQKKTEVYKDLVFSLA